MIKKMGKYLALIKFSHTIFAMPFAITGFFMALANKGFGNETLKILGLIVLCMVFARNAAMAFNRLVDRHIDALNPRTKSREIPAQIIKPTAAWFFVIINAILFTLTTLFINRLTFFLAPLALFVIMGYSYTKRFTFLSHFVLGLSLALAPLGAFIAVSGTITAPPVFLSLAVMMWVAGFDIIYALQDMDFDIKHKLQSIPAHVGHKKAKLGAVLTHFASTVFVVLTGLSYDAGALFWIGATVFIFLLSYQHLITYKYGLSKINRTFFVFNGIASFLFASFISADLLVA